MYREKLTRIIEDQSGATAIEYGLIAALVSVAAIGVLTALGTSLAGVYDLVTTTLGG
ncbi:MAG: Flp family type IVb pilin [Proteobacteria bacterium]|nr:Flp family type IVb pilin [Pseudomonadota bacterium]